MLGRKAICVFIVIGMAAAVSLAGATPASAQPSEVWVDDDWASSSPSDLGDGYAFSYDAFDNIQDGIDTVEAEPPNLAKPDTATHARMQEDYGKLRLSFEANQGQTDPQVKFLSRGSGYTVFLTSSEAVLTLRKLVVPTTSDAEDTQATEYAVLRMHLVGANPEPQVTGLEELPGKSNYFIGDDPDRWYTDVPNYASVEYEDVYPGVNLVYHGNQRQLEYDFVLAPGSDPGIIRLSFEGADKLTLDEEGNLILQIAGGECIQYAPIIYQEIDGVMQAIPGGYLL